MRLLLPLVGLLLVACSAAPTGTTGTAPPAPPGQTLRGVCPDPVVVQMNWFPQAEHGGLYRLLGDGFTVDAERKRASGPLLADGKDTGVRLEVRAGGPVTGFQRVSALMATDETITLGSIATDEAIQEAATHPTVAVFAPMDKSPQMIMWSPRRYPDWRTIADIGKTDATVLYSTGASYMDFLVRNNILKASQVDDSYDGSPARFVAEEGLIAQQGYATNEPYLYEKEIAAWRQPVRFALVHDSGYPIYPETLAVRAGDKERLAHCLRRLVPILQRSTLAYFADPGPTNEAVVRMVSELNAGYTYSVERAEFAVRQLRELGITDDGTSALVGDFDVARVRAVLNGAEVAPDSLVTNEFLDRSVVWP